jgi:hypothetical protein
MSSVLRPAPRRLRRLPLAACLGLALMSSETIGLDARAVPAPGFGAQPGLALRLGSKRKIQLPVAVRAHRPAEIAGDSRKRTAPTGTTITVTNCNDSGAGSLRSAVSIATSGDTVDLGSLTCGRITLTTGAIDIAQTDLTIIGPGAYQLAVDGNAQGGTLDRVFDHSGTGALTIGYLTLTDATYATYAADGVGKGGCIRSAGSVALLFSVVSSCRIAQGGDNTAAGGGVYAAERLDLIASILRDNTAFATSVSLGGGAVVLGPVSAKYSTVTRNTAYLAGGLLVEDSLTEGSFIDKSTISANHAQLAAGMVVAGSMAATIRNSTISGNRADLIIGGVYSQGPLYVQNSTIAFNEAGAAVGSIGMADVGLVQAGVAANLQSSIIANNRVDLSDVPRDVSVYDGGTIVGNSNLVTHTDVAMPADTRYGDPLLYPLSFNNGFTRTHALMDASPAIDAGNNSAGLVYDQRLMPRVVGANADVGAFERQGPHDSDFIFVDGFD